MGITTSTEKPEGLLESMAVYGRMALPWLTAAVVLYLVIPAIAILLFSSFRSTHDRLPFEATSFTLANFRQVFSSRLTYDLLLNSAAYTVGSVALGLGMATAFAWFLERTDLPWRRLLFVLILAPMAIPTIILAMAWILLANPTNGILNVALRSFLHLDSSGPLNIYSISGMVLVTGVRFVPMMYIMISGVFSRIDPSLEEAGSTSGAGRWTTFRRISLPLLTPALLAAVIYYLIVGIEVFEIPAMLGIPKRLFVFSSIIYYAIRPPTGFLPNYGLASTYGIILLLLASGLMYLYGRHTRETERFATVTGRGYRPRLIELGRWRYVPVTLIFGYFFLAVAIPFGVVVWKSLAPSFAKISYSTLSSLNFDHYRRMLAYPSLLKAAKNTVVIGLATSCITMILVTLVSWTSIRWKGMATALSEKLAFVILGVPGVVLALALVFTYISLPVGLYGTIWIIVIGLVTLCLPFGTRLMKAALLQIHRELEEAAGTCGAGMFSTFLHVVFPLIWPSFMRGFLWVFVRSISEATLALMLYSAGNQTVAVTLWYLWMDDGDFALASTIAVPMVIFSGGLAFLVAREAMLVKEGL